VETLKLSRIVEAIRHFQSGGIRKAVRLVPWPHAWNAMVILNELRLLPDPKN